MMTNVRMTRLVTLIALAIGCSTPAWAGPDILGDWEILGRAEEIVTQGRDVFRFDTFGDEAYWAGTLRLHEAIEGTDLGGVGPGISLRTALDLGLKVDVDALPARMVRELREGRLDLDDPPITVQIIGLDAILGIKGTVAGNSLQDVGITCALCHSTVDNSLVFGIGQRLDGFANRDLNAGAIIALAPNLQPIATLLGTDVATVQQVLGSWGPGKFDLELFLDGRAFNPQQVTDGVVTGTDVPGATLIPNAFALPGHNLHTWEGGWGTVTYWNALVANITMHGIGNFLDRRLDNAAKFPIAAANGFGHISVGPGDDRITSKLPVLHVYQLVLPAPTPAAEVDFDAAAAARGGELFSGQARCSQCHTEPISTEPGWNDHSAADIGIDAFQADRGPDDAYRTMNLAGIFVREEGLFMRPENKGRFYHDGRFATLMDVVNHYDTHFSLGLTTQQKSDLVEYLKSLGDPIQSTGHFPRPPQPDPHETSPYRSEVLNIRSALPSSPQAIASYTLAVAAPVTLKIFDVEGRLVTTLVDEVQDPGAYVVNWDSASSAGGVYLCRLRIGDRETATKFVVLR